MLDYEVGYGRPPKSTQFKPGQSGNPRGRKKGSKNTYTLLRDLLNKKVTVTTESGPTRLTKQQAILLQMTNKAATGDMKAITFVMQHLLKMDEKDLEHDAKIKQLNADDKQIIETWLKNNGTKH